jgi:hypothetical protein
MSNIVSGMRLTMRALGRSVLVVMAIVTPAWAELGLYDTTQQMDVVARAPQRYEKFEIPRDAGTDVFYVERTNPKITIKHRDIESVIVEERRTVMTDKGEVARDPYYAVTFVLRPPAAKAWNDFLGANADRRFGLRLGDRTLSIVRPVGRFQGNEFTTYLTRMNKPQLEQALAVLKAKLTWK